MSDSNAKKHILLVEDKEEHRHWFREEFRTLEKEYNIKISVDDASTYAEVCDLMVQVNKHEKVFDCAVVDMQMLKENNPKPDKKDVHWGVQALKKIQEILQLDKILIVTAFKGDVVPHLSEAEKRRLRTKNIHIRVFRDDVARMLDLMQA